VCFAEILPKQLYCKDSIFLQSSKINSFPANNFIKRPNGNCDLQWVTYSSVTSLKCRRRDVLLNFFNFNKSHNFCVKRNNKFLKQTKSQIRYKQTQLIFKGRSLAQKRIGSKFQLNDVSKNLFYKRNKTTELIIKFNCLFENHFFNFIQWSKLGVKIAFWKSYFEYGVIVWWQSILGYNRSCKQICFSF